MRDSEILVFWRPEGMTAAGGGEMSGSGGGIADAPCRSAGSCICTTDSNIWTRAVCTFPTQRNALEASRVIVLVLKATASESEGAAMMTASWQTRGTWSQVCDHVPRDSQSISKQEHVNAAEVAVRARASRGQRNRLSAVQNT